MGSQEINCLAVSDFNLDTFAGYLTNEPNRPYINTTVAPFGQVMQVLLDETLSYWQNRPDCTVIWTQPQQVSESFRRIITYEPVPVETVWAEVDHFSDVLKTVARRVEFVFVPTWVLPPHYRGPGLLNLRMDSGPANILMQMNLRLARNLQDHANIYLLDAQRWLAAAGKHAVNPKLWYMAKSAFGNQVFKEAVSDLKAALAGLRGQARKLIVLDLDDTLWGGIVGDAGWQNLQLGGHDPVGEAFVDFQNALKALTNRGIILAIVSKNEESVALEAIKQHPEMALKIDDFAGWRINWQDKAQNVADLVSALNLGLQSVVFIDDNPVERARVREMLPEVLVPDWPADKMLYAQTLHSMTCFDAPALSQEDLKRSQMYATERQRTALKQQVGSLDEWLTTLDIGVTVETLTPTNLPRTVQLLNKTNQMNLSTRRMSEMELMAWLQADHRQLWTFRVADKFGDSGLTGIISLEAQNGTGKIVDFVLSCRVMGRKVEETMLATVIDYARSIGLDEVYAVYQPTAKNNPCLEFWQRSGFDSNETGDTFSWKTKAIYPFPEQVQVTHEYLAIS